MDKFIVHSHGLTSARVFFDSTLSQFPIILRMDAKYARPNTIHNHTNGLYRGLPSLLLSGVEERER